MKVFLSSTYEDLSTHRSLLLNTLQRMNVDAIAMEYFSADPRSPIELCRVKVLESDVYLGVFGWRYGSIDKQSGMSVTEIEYRTALAAGIPPMLYVASEAVAILPDAVDKGAGARKLQRLKAELNERHTVARFTIPEDLSRRVAVDLYGLIHESPEPPRQRVPIDAPVEPTINAAHPLLLCHTVEGEDDGLYDVRLYLDLYLTDENEDDLDEVKKTLKTIDRVVYQLHKSFPIPTAAMQNWREYFELRLRVYGEFWIQATVFFLDSRRPPVVLQRFVNLSVPEPLSD